MTEQAQFPPCAAPDAAAVPAPNSTEPESGSGSELRLLLAIAAPNVAATAAETLLSFVDFLIVSRLGSTAQAAVQSSAMIYLAIFALPLGMMVCVTTVVSQSLGANRPRDCSGYAWQGIWIGLLFGIVGIAAWPLIPLLYRIIGHEAAVQVMEVDYTRLRLLGLGASAACVALTHFFNGVHQPRQGAISVVVSNVINAGLACLLVFGLWGFPALGVKGAAIATLIATLFRMAWLLVAMCLGNVARQFATRQTWRWNAEKAWRLIRVGWPAGVGFLLDISAWAFFLVCIIGQFGTVHLAATSTCWRFSELSFMPAVGIGIAVSTLVGRAIGAGRLDLARRRAAIGTMVNMVYMGLMGLIFIVWGRPILGVFSKEPEVIAVGIEVVRFVALYQLFDAVAITYSNALRGAGDTRWPMVIGAVQAWIIMVGGGWFMARRFPLWGSNGPWIFAATFVIVIGITFWIRWQRGRWEQLDVIGRQESGPPDIAGREMTLGEPAVLQTAVNGGNSRE